MTRFQPPCLILVGSNHARRAPPESSRLTAPSHHLHRPYPASPAANGYFWGKLRCITQLTATKTPDFRQFRRNA